MSEKVYNLEKTDFTEVAIISRACSPREKAVYDVTNGIPLDELSALCKAYKEGRAVVLPCKVGDVLYDIFEFVENRCSPDICEYNAESIEICKDKRGQYFVIDSTNFRPEDFGKTVFLTREEAEKALEGMK